MTTPLGAWRAEGLGHEDPIARSTVLEAVAGDAGTTPDAAAHAIRQIDRHGWRRAFAFPHLIAELPHCRESVTWAAATMERPTPGDERDADADPAGPRRHVAGWLAVAPVAWLAPEIDRLAAADRATAPPPEGPGASTTRESALDVARDRVALSGFTDEECRARLDLLLLRCLAHDDFPDAVIPRMRRTCEAIGRRHAIPRDELATWLDLDPKLTAPDSEIGFDAFRAGAALMIIEHDGYPPPFAAIPKLFGLDWDWTNARIAAALTRSGSPETLDAALEAYPRLAWPARADLATVIQRLRFAGREASVIELLQLETDDVLRTRLARALALYGTPRATAVALQVAREIPGDPEREAILDLACIDALLHGRHTPEIRGRLRSMRHRRDRALPQ